jgi:osmotically-inducible protein OsmY
MIYSREETLRKISEQLYWDSRVDSKKISVEIVDSTVRLNGSTSTNYSKQAAESDVWAVPGVTKVENLITVQIPDSMKIPNDNELRDSIRNLFDWDPALASEEITVSVYNGVVTLEGTVGEYWKKTRALELSFNVGGVISVENRLSVVPTHDVLDEIIAIEIENAFERNIEITADTIDVKVEVGDVTISGTVSDWNAYSAAEEIVHRTTGVRNVQNRLVILPTT